MTARETIENLWDRPIPIATLLDAYAHELAEKIRDAYSQEGPPEYHWIMNPYDAAAIIDPEVS
jgi:hypothetical protein